VIHQMTRAPAITAVRLASAKRHPQGHEQPANTRGTRLAYTRRMMLTVTQAATRLGLNPGTVRRLCGVPGGIKAVKFGKAWLIQSDDLNRYVQRPSGGQVKGAKIKAASVTRRKYARNG
jgi:excisionase family DNA binding protein